MELLDGQHPACPFPDQDTDAQQDGSRRAIDRRAFAAAALAAGCGDDDEGDATTRPATAAATPTNFDITATAEGKTKKALEFPATVKAGLVQMSLANEDELPRSAQIIRVVGDHTVEDVLKIVNAEQTKIPDWMQDGGGIATVKPGEVGRAMQLLAPGKYVIWDDEGGIDEDAPGHDELGAKGEFTVTGPAVDAELPAQPATVTATDLGEGDDKEYDFEFEGLKAGTNRVRFENTGEELHHALFFRSPRAGRSRTSNRRSPPARSLRGGRRSTSRTASAAP